MVITEYHNREHVQTFEGTRLTLKELSVSFRHVSIGVATT